MENGGKNICRPSTVEIEASILLSLRVFSNGAFASFSPPRFTSPLLSVGGESWLLPRLMTDEWF